MLRFYTETEVAKCLHKERRWLLDWLLANPLDKYGQPFYIQIGRSKRFTGDNVMRIIDTTLTQEEAGRSQSFGEGWVYFIDGGEHIKIGFSRSLETRVVKMATDSPNGARLLFAEPGTYQDEQALHRQFASLRLRGEWFQKGPELLAHIEQRRKKHRMEPDEIQPRIRIVR